MQIFTVTKMDSLQYCPRLCDLVQAGNLIFLCGQSSAKVSTLTACQVVGSDLIKISINLSQRQLLHQ